MLKVIWHLRGSVALDRIESNGAVLDRLERLLKKQQKGRIGRGADYLNFDTPFWDSSIFSNLRAMAIYDRGRFWISESIDERSLRYDLRSFHAFVLCLCGGSIAFFFGLAGNGVAFGLQLGMVAIGWLYGMNVLFAIVRVPAAIRKAARANRSQALRNYKSPRT